MVEIMQEEPPAGLWPRVVVVSMMFVAIACTAEPIGEAERVARLPEFAFSNISFVQVPAGEARLGSSAAEIPNGLEESEKQRIVRFEDSFLISKYEITNAQFRQFIRETAFKGDPAREDFLSHFHQNDGNIILDDDDAPVVFVSRLDTFAFCRWLSKREGRVFRIPTSEEWEYACRAGSAKNFCFGNDAKQLEHFAWIQSNSHGRTHNVGTKLPNSWGLYDVHGNVWEWCSGELPEKFASKTSFDSKSIVAPIRGGSCESSAASCRCAAQWAGFPPETRRATIGFRIVCEMPDVKR